MKIIFYGNHKGNFFDKLIRWWTSPLKKMFNGEWKDSFSHCEILFSDGVMFSASQYENSTRFRRHSYSSDSWKYVNTYATKVQEARVRTFCNSIEDSEYDYMGILGFIFPVKDSERRWFCSEVCTFALQKASMVEDLTASKTSPNRLYKELVWLDTQTSLPHKLLQ